MQMHGSLTAGGLARSGEAPKVSPLRRDTNLFSHNSISLFLPAALKHLIYTCSLGKVWLTIMTIARLAPFAVEQVSLQSISYPA